MSRGTLLIPAGDWQTVLHTPTSLVLYNPPSHALTVLPHPFPSGPSNPRSLGRADDEGASSTDGETSQDEDEVEESLCPYCKRPMADADGGINIPSPSPSSYPYTQPTSRYFAILSQANTPISTPSRRPSSSSRRRTIPSLFGARSSSPSQSSSPRAAFVDEYESDDPPPNTSTSSARPNGNGRRKRSRSRRGDRVQEEEEDQQREESSQSGADGYYERFFKEEGRLGMGAQGTVFLCQHILDNQPLGLYAVKKVAVGESHDYLLKVLREVQLLQTLRHENIVTYHHAWIERTRFSSFGPKVQALHILMQFASSGSLEDYILTRTLPSTATADSPLDAFHLAELSPEEAKAAIRARRSSKGVVAGGGRGGGKSGGFGGGEKRAVRLLGREEIEEVFGGVVKGLGYLHDHGILHLDLKCSNVLLHQEEGDLIPRALISDFGTSRAVVYGGGREQDRRSGNTGTMEYCAPESLMIDREGRLLDLGREGDLWSLGMVLYKLLFFKLPYSQIEDFDLLASEIKAYPGFTPTPALVASFQRRGLPRELLHILTGLLNVDPRKRPSCEQVLTTLQSGMKDDAFHFPEYYEPDDVETDPSKRLAPFVPHFPPPLFGPSLEQDDRGSPLMGEEEEDGGFGLRSLSRTASEGSFDSVRTETPARPLSPLVPFASSHTKTPLLHPPPSKSRILLPPPYRRPSHPLLLLLQHHLPSLLILAKFLSLYLFLPRAPSLVLQLAVLALALVGRGRNGRGGNGRGVRDGRGEGWWDWEMIALGIGHVMLMIALGGWRGGVGW